MAKQVRWSRQAENDLTEAVQYIAQDSPAYAVSFAEKVFDVVRRLADLPHSGHVVEELEVNVLREVPVKGYRLIYRINDTVEIVGLVQGARDLPALWRRGDRA